MKKRHFGTIALLTVSILLSSLSLPASALSWDGSSTGGSGAGSPAGANGYAIRTSSDNCVGYRFSVVDKSGNNRVSKVIDVFRDTYYGNLAYDSAYKFNSKLNKKQLITYQNDGFSTSDNKTNCYKEANMGFNQALPMTSGMNSWQNDNRNLNPILATLGISSGIAGLKNGDKVLVEPLYDIRLQSIYHSITVTETAIYGKYILGENSDGGSSNNPNSWGFISGYVNKNYPNELYTPDGQGLWTGVEALSKRATFRDIINKGYGVGIAYTETKPDFTPALSVRCTEVWPGALGNWQNHYGISYGSTFGNYTYANGYPTKGDTVWFAVNFPEESENIYVRQSVRLQGGNWKSRNVYSNSNTWYDVALSPATVDASRSSYVVEAKADWIDTKGNVLKYGTVKTFYIPVKPKINRYQVSMVDYSGMVAAKGGSGGYSGAVYVGQKVYPQYTYTSENSWTSKNHFTGSLYSWKSGAWQVENGSADLSANNVGINKSSSYSRYSSLYPYRVPNNSGNTNGENRIPFLLTSAWASDAAHTEESTWIDIPIVKADVELLDILLIDENGNYISGGEVWAYQTVTPQYVYRNNSSVPVYVEGYEKNTTKIPGVYMISPGSTVRVSGATVTIPAEKKFDVWGGVYLEGAGCRHTTWETDGSNNQWLRYWQVKTPLKIETVAPNTIYREGTQVITSFKVKNESSIQFVPGSNVSVKFTAQKGSAVLYSTIKTGVVVPGNNEQLVYFKWTVPNDLNRATITVKGEVMMNGTVVDTATRSISSNKVPESQTPDTDYEAAKPTGWSQPTLPSAYATQATWSEWVYMNGSFQKKTYGMQILTDTVKLTPDSQSPSAQLSNGIWNIKSGYGFSIYYFPTLTSVNGYLYPSNAAYTSIQHGEMQYPEFGYSGAAGQYRTIQRSGGAFQFVANPTANGSRIHFLPVWYPDGDYQATCYFYDLWTPAGMIVARLDTNKLMVNGSMYDDWYVGRTK